MTAAGYSALTTLPGRAGAEALAAAAEVLDPVGAGVFEIEDGSGRWEVGLHFEDPPDEVALALLAAAHGAAPFAVSAVPEIDWVAHVRRELSPVRAGRFFVHGSHDADKVPQGVEPLLIEAAMAFGTGHHDTTRGCLEALDQMAATAAPRSVADIGAGTAVLAMAAARLWPDAAVIASDNDPIAVETAAANVRANGLERIEVLLAEGMRHPRLRGPFDLILANILKQPLIALAPAMAAALARGGQVVLSGILLAQAPAVEAAWAAQGARRTALLERGDWATLVLRRDG